MGLAPDPAHEAKYGRSESDVLRDCNGTPPVPTVAKTVPLPWAIDVSPSATQPCEVVPGVILGHDPDKLSCLVRS